MRKLLNEKGMIPAEYMVFGLIVTLIATGMYTMISPAVDNFGHSMENRVKSINRTGM